MARSMTGFGRSESVTDTSRITVEIRSVNHRYLDLSIKMPRRLSFLEGRVRNLLKEYAVRGKTDIFITYEDYAQGASSLKYNRLLAGQYLAHLKDMSAELALDFDIRTSTLARFPEVFTMEEPSIDEDALWQQLRTPLTQACRRFADSRSEEGQHLKADLIDKLSRMDRTVTQIEERSPSVVAEYRQKLTDKVAELLDGTVLDESRLAAEVVLYADKICNDEETVRLHSHIRAMTDLLLHEEGIGRKLDFIAQEMNREANTILSKSGDLAVSDLGIELKTEIEKIREQVQNIE